MKIVQMSLATFYGGAERHAIELANHLSARHEVYYFLSKKTQGNGTRMAEQLAPGVRPVFVDPLFAGARVWSLLRKIDPDIVHCHTPNDARTVGFLRRRAACVGTLHTWFRYEYRRCDGLVRVADWQADAMRNWPGLCETVRNWSLPGRTLGAIERQALRASLGATDRTAVIVSVGRLHRQKRFDVLLEAFGRAVTPGDDVQLWIVGRGPDEAKLRQLAGPNVRMLGFRDDTDLLLGAADMFALSSDFEACPLVVLEAMEAKLPLVLSDIPAHREIAGGVTAGMAPPGDPAAFAAALSGALRHPRDKRQYDLSGFRIDNQVAKIEAFYERVAAQCRSAA